jgi:hypothetical protein
VRSQAESPLVKRLEEELRSARASLQGKERLEMEVRHALGLRLEQPYSW